MWLGGKGAGYKELQTINQTSYCGLVTYDLAMTMSTLWIHVRVWGSCGRSFGSTSPVLTQSINGVKEFGRGCAFAIPGN